MIRNFMLAPASDRQSSSAHIKDYVESVAASSRLLCTLLVSRQPALRCYGLGFDGGSGARDPLRPAMCGISSRRLADHRRHRLDGHSALAGVVVRSSTSTKLTLFSQTALPHIVSVKPVTSSRMRFERSACSFKYFRSLSQYLSNCFFETRVGSCGS